MNQVDPDLAIRFDHHAGTAKPATGDGPVWCLNCSDVGGDDVLFPAIVSDLGRLILRIQFVDEYVDLPDFVNG